jgi:hypothetical protein
MLKGLKILHETMQLVLLVNNLDLFLVMIFDEVLDKFQDFIKNHTQEQIQIIHQ